MFEVIEPGLETTIQDFPGRIGFWEQGFPPSGPMDSWSFRQANILVGNEPGEAGLECQFTGPKLRFLIDGVIAVTGADMHPTIDDAAIPMWESWPIRSGQVLSLGYARDGARTYIATAGGVDVPPVLGSRSTFHMAGIGGYNGHALQAGQRILVGAALNVMSRRRVKQSCRPPIGKGGHWDIEVVPGPNDDWIDESGHRKFLTSNWKLSAKSSRTGFRLQGPDWTFTEKATSKRPEHGHAPSNILDHGYPIGAINLAGQTPIILVNDSPSGGGFINPYTVPTAALWKLAQSRPGDIYHFIAISLKKAQEMRRALDRMCTPASLE